MLDFLPGYVKGVLSLLLYLVNTIVLCLIIFVVAFIKLIIPVKCFTEVCNRVLVFIATLWISINSFSSDLFNRIEWEITGRGKLELKNWYLVLCNHQSWVDILVLQKVFNKKIPMLKFFLKKELIWVPFLGLAWWALDFPFMRRYSTKFLEKYPHLRGKDLETTKKACEKFKTMPVAVMNFVEGTRFTKEKHKAQSSQFNNLLKPRAGGIAFVLGAMGESFQKLVNVTIVYPDGADTFWGFISGRVKHIIIDVEVFPVTSELTGDYFNNSEFKADFCSWLNDLWGKKDIKIKTLLNSSRDKAKGD
ncbi:MAG: acyltransferase [Thermodesulfobacteriota bacterium]|nr:acyltransferase [Thermodesulfobacteriota bacterium]